MAIINNIDLGAHATWQAPLSTRKGTTWGSEVQTVTVEGGQSLIWSKAGTIRKRTETIWITTNPASSAAALRLLRQLQETANNPALQPVYIQWASGGGVIVVDPEDGWYVLETADPDTEVTMDGIIPVTISVSYIAAGIPSRGLALAYTEGVGSFGYSGSIQEVTFPVNSDSFPGTSQNRPGAEGTSLVTSAPNTVGIVSPLYFRPSATVADLFKNRCSVWDTINTSANPVPTAGAFVNPNWIEVFQADHLFLGDCVATNGHLLLLFQLTQTSFIQCWVWNWITPGWLPSNSIQGLDPSANTFSLKAFAVQAISHYESSIRCFISSSIGQQALLLIKVVRGEFYARIQFTPITFTVSTNSSLTNVSTSAPKVQFTDQTVRDSTLAADQGFSFPNGNTGFVAQFTANTSFPSITGFLYLVNPGGTQGVSGSTGIAIGDTLDPTTITQSRFYGFFVVPFTNPQNYQAEGESGVLGTGWTSTADALASAGNTAKVASGTLTNNADLFGTSFVPIAGGSYNVFFRVKVTSAAGTGAALTLGWWDTTAAGFLANASTTYAANKFTTLYTWVCVNQRTLFDAVTNGTTTVTSATALFTAADVGKTIQVTLQSLGTIASITNSTTVVTTITAVTSATGGTLIIGGFLTPIAAHNMQFRAVTAATLGTDYFIDEAVITPISGIGASSGTTSPKECWQFFAFDRTSKIIPI